MHSAGFGGSHREERVRDINPEEPWPEGAVKVSDDAELTDWQVSDTQPA